MTQHAEPGARTDAFRLYDTATQLGTPFEPVVPGLVSIYHCGLTVQAGPHLGHIRKEVVFDVLRRWLTWSGYEVTVIANITDIDDKILIKSAEAGVPWFAHAYRFERELHDAYAALGCLPPTYEPRATGHIPEMIEMIKVLIERGHVPGTRFLRRCLLRRQVLAGVRLCPTRTSTTWNRPPIPIPAERGTHETSPLEGPQEQRAGDGQLGDTLGSRPSRMAPGVLGHGQQVPGR